MDKSNLDHGDLVEFLFNAPAGLLMIKLAHKRTRNTRKIQSHSKSTVFQSTIGYIRLPFKLAMKDILKTETGDLDVMKYSDGSLILKPIQKP